MRVRIDNPRFEGAEEHVLRHASGSRARVVAMLFALYGIGAWKLLTGLCRAVVVSRMSGLVTMEPGFCSCDATGDTQDARESSRSSGLATS